MSSHDFLQLSDHELILRMRRSCIDKINRCAVCEVANGAKLRTVSATFIYHNHYILLFKHCSLRILFGIKCGRDFVLSCLHFRFNGSTQFHHSKVG